MKYGIGVDIGGTKISVILGTERGKILQRRQIKTKKYAGKKACMEALSQAITEMVKASKLRRNQILGIGIGLPGAVNSQKGIVPKSPNMQGWAGLPIRKILKRTTGFSVSMTNDANAAVMAEKIFGQGKRAENLIYMTVSTGVGGGIIVNGHLLEGSNYVGGEIGHMVIKAGGNKCGCGQRGCLEAYASGVSIAKHVKKELKKKPLKKHLKKFNAKGQISAKEIGEAAIKGNTLAIAAYRRAGYYLGVGIGNLLNVLNPEMVILGGGVFKSAPKGHWKATMASCKKHAWPESLKLTKIVRTKLGDDVGNLGALALVFAKN